MYLLPPQPETSAEEIIRFADWIELNLITSKESVLSIADVTSILAADPPDDSSMSEHRMAYRESDSDEDSRELNDGYWQQAEQTAELVFSELSHRSRWFDERYPIQVDGECATTNDSFDSFTIAKFLSLLRSRHLYGANLDDEKGLPGELFEELLPHTVRCYLGTEQHHSIRFGVAGGSRGGELPVDLDSALDELSKRMHEPRGELRNLPNARDLGIDSITWKPFGDSLRGKLTAIGQATISEGAWLKKQHSPKWLSGRLIRLLSFPTYVVSFVESISLTKSDYLDGLPQKVSILPLDRFRILRFLHDHDVPADLLDRLQAWSEGMCDRLPLEQ